MEKNEINAQAQSRYEIELNHIPIVWDMEKGTLSFHGIKSALFWLNPSILTMIQPMADDIGHDLFKMMIAFSASHGTDEDYYSMVTVLGKNFEEGFLNWGKAVSTAGWGTFSMPHYDNKSRTARVIVRNTWELLMQESIEKRWGCPFIQGKIIGIFSHAFGVCCWADSVDICYVGENKYVEFFVHESERTIEKELARLKKQRMRDKEKQLSHEVDRKTEQLRIAKKKLEEHSLILEKKVKSRTIELEKQNQQLNHALKELEIAKNIAEEANKLKSRFLANMSHEIRTPINSILNFTDVLLRKNFDVESKEFLCIINKSGKTLLHLINDVLDFSKIEADKIELTPAPFCITNLLADVEKMFELQSSQKNIGFSVEWWGPSLCFDADAFRLKQILMNLVANAIKFTSTGTVTVNARHQKGQLTVVVSDTGIGIPIERIDDVFLPFEQADTSISRAFEGAGLGLAISKKIVELMSGLLNVKSEEGKGTMFTVVIPLVPLNIDKILSEIKTDKYDKQYRQIFGTMLVEKWHGDFVRDYGEELCPQFNEYLVSLPYCLSQVENAFAADDIGKLRELVHEILGVAGTLYITEIYHIAKKMNIHIHSEGTSRSDLKALVDSMADVIALIPDQYLKQNSERIDRVKTRSQDRINKKKKILVAEDNPFNQKIVEIFLDEMGYSYKVVSDGEEAIAELSYESYSLLLLDMQMPVIDGMEVLRYIRERREYDELFVIALTAHAIKGDAERYLAAGCNDYMAKPIDRDLFWMKVEKALSRS